MNIYILSLYLFGTLNKMTNLAGIKNNFASHEIQKRLFFSIVKVYVPLFNRKKLLTVRFNRVYNNLVEE